jgi:hypothetical protein
MSNVIISFSPFYLVREGLSDEDGLNLKPRIDPCDVGFLKLSEMSVISASPEVPETEDTLLKRLSAGWLCIGIKHHDEIAAYMWCSLRECNSPYLSFYLREDEACLLDARTFSSYRGKNLAPYLRVQLYKHLRQMGRTKFISITQYFNTPSLRFKKKLNAKPQKLYVYICLFRKYKRVILLKRYKI